MPPSIFFNDTFKYSEVAIPLQGFRFDLLRLAGFISSAAFSAGEGQNTHPLPNPLGLSNSTAKAFTAATPTETFSGVFSPVSRA